jgi:hypothetical protein
VVSFLLIWTPKPTTHFCTPPLMQHAQPISSSLIWPYKKYLARKTNYKALLNRFFQPSITSSSLVPNIFFNTLFLNTLSLCSSFSVRDRFLHPYKRNGKIIQRSLRNNVTNNLIPKTFLTLMYTWHRVAGGTTQTST